MRPTAPATAAPGSRAPRRARPGRRWLITLTMLALIVGLVPALPAGATGTAQVDVYFGRPHDTRCDLVRAHRRTVETPGVLRGALEELLEGPTPQERRSGASSWFSYETAGMLRSVAIRDGVAHVDFGDLRRVIPGASSSCGRDNLLAELDRTVLQFATVHRVRYSIEGSERTFYEWLQTSPPPRSGVARVAGSLRNTAPLHGRGDGRGVGEIRRIRVGRHDGFDRVVFQFSGRGRPWYHVSYTPVARADGSGMPIPVEGNVALEVIIMAASVDLNAPDFARTYTPATPITPRFPTLRQVRDGGEFEATTTFGLGLKGRTGFRVLELKHPSRLAIDVAHGATVRRLRRGHRGADVADWQARLATVQHGYFAVSQRPFPRPLAADGVYGKRTARATRVFQRAEGVRVTGVVDGATRAAMHRALRHTNRIPV